MAASKRAEASAENISNMSSAGTVDGSGAYSGYRAQTTVQSENAGGGVSAENVVKKPGMVNAYAPESPFANSEGLIGTPDVDLAEEAVNLKLAEIAYKANASVIRTANEMSDALNNVFDKKV